MKMKKVISFILVLLLTAGVFSGTASGGFEYNSVSAVTYNEYLKEEKSSDYAKNDLCVSDNSAELYEGGKLSYNFTVLESALYALEIEYTTVKDNNEEIEFGILIDGKLPFDEANSIELSRYYRDDGKVRLDANGNEAYAFLKEEYGTYNKILTDSNNADYLYFKSDSGEHTLELNGTSGKALINKVVLKAVQKPVEYSEYIKKEAKDYRDKPIILEAEGKDLYLKSSDKIVGLANSSSANVSPSSYKTDKINYTGGPNWSQPGDSISYKVTVPKSGYYKLAVNYKQSYTLNTTFYRELRINGEIPFKEAKNIAFPYARNWIVTTLGDGNSEYKFYFEAGKEYILSLSVTLGPLSGLCEELDTTAEDIASLYRDIVMVTGDSVDASRDYNLFNLVDNWDKRLKNAISALDKISAEMEDITGSSGSSTISTISNLRFVLNEMLTNKYSAHKQVDKLYTYYASLCSLMGELRKMPLDLDRIIFASPDSKLDGIKAGFFKSFSFGIKKFVLSFANDYSATKNSKNREKITIWVNWGRDQTKVLKTLIQSDFSQKHNIDVDIKVTNATLTHAMLSGNGPDLMLHISRSEPVNLAMRDALYDLTNFDGKGEYKDLPVYSDVLENFAETASVPYWFERDGHKGLYALPDTQTFFMMFIREDIFSEFGLGVPKTWDEFNSAAVTLLRNNMQVGLPYTQIVQMEQVNVGAGALSIFPTLMIQKGLSFYNSDFSATDMLGKEVINTFESWTDYYEKFGFPQTYDFFNRFRVGLMPMAIQPYTSYATVSAAASEINGKWSMYEIPGVVTENGINNSAAGGGTGAGILSTSENKGAAWEFLCWWTSADTQYQYCFDVESILGPSARVATANIEALKKFEWSDKNLSALLGQLEKVEEIPEVPGGYSVARIIDQAFWNTVNGGEDVQDMLIKWTKVADGIIERKRQQYGLSKEAN